MSTPEERSLLKLPWALAGNAQSPWIRNSAGEPALECLFTGPDKIATRKAFVEHVNASVGRQSDQQRARGTVKPHNNPAAGFLLYKSDAPHLAQLTAPARAMLQAATDHGMQYEAIAASLGMPIGTVKSRIHRSREKVLKLRAQAAAAAESNQLKESADD